MRITKINTYLVRPRWCMVEVLTDGNISGWGEAVIEGKAATVSACVKEMEEYLVGKNPCDIEDLWNTLYRAAFYRGGPPVPAKNHEPLAALFPPSGHAAGGGPRLAAVLL